MRNRIALICILVLMLVTVFVVKQSASPEVISVVQGNESANADIQKTVLAVEETPNELRGIENSTQEATEIDVKDCPRFDRKLIRQNGSDINSEETYILAYKENPTESARLVEALHLLRSKNAKDKRDALVGFLNSYPENKFAKWSLLTLCSSPFNNTDCSESSVKEMVNLDVNNGAVWMNLASYYFKLKDQSNAILALRNFINAPYFDEYLDLAFETYESSIPGQLPLNLKLLFAIDMVNLTTSTSISKVASFCKRKALASTEFSQLCLDAGTILEADSVVLKTHKSGLALKEFGYKGLQDERYKKLEENRKNRRSKYPNGYKKAKNLTMYDESLLIYWYEAYKNHGELKALEMLIEEARRVSGDPGYNPCPNKSN